MVEKANPSVRLKPATFPFRDDKRAAKEILFGKIEKSQILITQSINFIQKNAMKLHFSESFAQAFREPQSMHPEENGAVADRFRKAKML